MNLYHVAPDPRLNQSATVNLPDQNGSETNMSLPLAAGRSRNRPGLPAGPW
jgi:hypothetical protein